MKFKQYGFSKLEPQLARRGRALPAIVAFILLTALSITPQKAAAQLYAGTLSGSVTDSSGAVVANATVTLTDVARGIQRTTITDATGRYLFSSLLPAVYSEVVSATGFENASIPDITININKNATANVVLKIGATSLTVVVKSGLAEGVQTEDGSNGQVVDQNLIANLPMVGRAVFDLAYLAPGVSPASGGTFTPGASTNNFVSQGSRNAQADIVIDGVSTTNYEQNSGWVQPLYQPSVDAVQEFKIQQTNFSAEFGFTGATVINMVTRSGSNAYHGSLYEYMRNTVLNSENYFAKKSGTPNPSYHWNDFGGTASFPIKKDKIFGFFDFEATRQVTPATLTLDLPTDRERAGDFGQICSNAGGSFDNTGRCSASNGQIWDPYAAAHGASYQHISTRFIPYNNLATYSSQGVYENSSNAKVQVGGGVGNLINPVSRAILNYIPHAQNQNVIHSNYIGNAKNISNWNQYDAKVDYQINSNNNLSTRWSTGWGHSEAGNLFGNAFDAHTQGPVQSVVYEGSLNYVHTFSPKTLLTVTAGATHSWGHTRGNPFDDTKIGMPASLATNPAGGVAQTPSIVVNGYAGESGTANFGAQGWSVMMYGQDMGHTSASLSHSIGRHDLKVGGEIRIHRINFTQWGIPNGRYEYQSVATSGDNNLSSSGGDAYASYMIGFATGWNAQQVPASPATQNLQYAVYVQDNWKVNSKLTVNLGFRYDLDMPRTERHDRMSYFDPTKPSPIAEQVSGVSASECPACAHLMGALEYAGGHNSRYPFNVYKNAVGPRLGFAYALQPSTAIRGGVGIYYDPGKSGAAGTGSGAAGFQGYATQSTWTSYSSDDNITPNYQSIIGQNAPYRMPYGKSFGNGTQLGQSLLGVPINNLNTLPREFSWSIGVEHEFAGHTLLDVNYIGKHAQHLYMGGFVNYLDHIPASEAANLRANPTQINTPVPVPAALSEAIGNATVPEQGEWNNPLGPKTSGGGSWYAWNGFLPFPQFAYGVWGNSGIQNVDPPIGRSNYRAIALSVSRPMLKGLQFLGNYTAQRSLDNASSQGSNEWINPSNPNGVQDPNDLKAEYAHSAFNMGQIAQITFVYQLPFGKGQRFSSSSGPLNILLSNWQASGGYRWDSGQPILLGGGGQPTLPGYGSRPNLTGTLKKNSGNQGVMVNGVMRGNYFKNPSALTKPADYTDGSAPRVLPSTNAPGGNNMDLAIDKRFPIKLREGMEFKFRWESYNLFNHVQYGAPNGSPSFDSNGKILGSAQGSNFGALTWQANSPRIQQVSLRINF